MNPNERDEAYVAHMLDCVTLPGCRLACRGKWFISAENRLGKNTPTDYRFEPV